MIKRKKIRIKIIPFEKYQEFYFTLEREKDKSERLNNFLLNLEKNDFRIVRVIFFGDKKETVKAGELAKKYPLVTLAHAIALGKNTDYFSANIFAVKGSFEYFDYIKHENRIIGSNFGTKNEKYLYLGGLSADRNGLQINFREEVDKVYALLDKILAQYEFLPSDIYRFWNYMENISENYTSFNRARDKYFRKHKISDYPAATGIGAKLPGKENIYLGLEAVKVTAKKNITIKNLRSDFQCEASMYGPKFSRAKMLKYKDGDIRKIFVSGTSSVNREGKSVLCEKKEKNIEYTVSCVENLLKKAGMSLNDILESAVYFKNEKIEKIFREEYKKNKWSFPYCPLFVEICRPDLFFEMECIAFRLSKNKHYINHK